MTADRGEDSNALSCEGLSVGYGRATVVSDVDLSVAAGETLGIIGANGVGKSTLLKTLSGILRPLRGDIYLHGRSVSDSDARSRIHAGLGHVLEGRRIFHGLSVRENLVVGGRGAGVPSNELADHVDATLKMPVFAPLSERQEELAGNLSGGQQQLLAVGTALVRSPDVLLLDEPALGLAPTWQTQIVDLVDDLRQSGMALLVAEQSVRFAREACDRFLLLAKGHIEPMSHSQLDAFGDQGFEMYVSGSQTHEGNEDES